MFATGYVVGGLGIYVILREIDFYYAAYIPGMYARTLLVYSYVVFDARTLLVYSYVVIDGAFASGGQEGSEDYERYWRCGRLYGSDAQNRGHQ